MFLIDKICKRFNKAEKTALHENVGAYQERLSQLTTSVPTDHIGIQGIYAPA